MVKQSLGGKTNIMNTKFVALDVCSSIMPPQTNFAGISNFDSHKPESFMQLFIYK